MGYRSDIRITMTKSGYEKFKDFVDKKAKEHVERLKNDLEYRNNSGVICIGDDSYDYNLLNSLDVNKDYKQIINYSTKEEGLCKYIGWNDVKWYEGSYKDVDIIMEGLDYISNLGHSYRYARMGEDYSDVDEMCNDGDLEEDYLDYPNLCRYFDDDMFN